MQIPFKQKYPWGCGHYTLANLFNDARFLEDIEERTPSFIYDMQKSLDKYQPGVWLSPIFFINSSLPIQNRFVDTSLFDLNFEKLSKELIETHCRAFLVSIKSITLHHLILVLHRLQDNLFYIFDSLREEPVVMTPDDFTFHYHVCEIWHFENQAVKDSLKDFNEEGVSLFFNYDFLEHLKP